MAVKPCSGFWDFDGTMHKRSFYILRLGGPGAADGYLARSLPKNYSQYRTSLGDERWVLEDII